MILKESIDQALEELWQLAMTLASLKQIAGIVSQEVETSQTPRDEDEENIKTTDSRGPHQVVKTEVKADNCPATIDITADIKAEEKSVHQEGNIEDTYTQFIQTRSQIPDDKKENHLSSAVAHQLQMPSANFEQSDVSASMVAHMIRLTDENCDIERPLLPSMSAHICPLIISTKESDEKIEGKKYEDHPESITLISHQASSLEILEDSTEYLVSMVSHMEEPLQYENKNEMEMSFLTHQTTDHQSIPEKVDKILSLLDSLELNIEKEIKDREITDEDDFKIQQEKDDDQATKCMTNNNEDIGINNLTSDSIADEIQEFASFSAHESADNANEQEQAEFQLSMASHQHILLEREENASNTCSVVAHHQYEYQTCKESNNEKNLNKMDTEDLDRMYVIPSLVSHMIPAIETPTFLTEPSISLVTHSIQHSSEDESIMLPVFTTSSYHHFDTYVKATEVGEDTICHIEMEEGDEEKSSSPNSQKSITSMISHQMTEAETLEEECVFLTTMAAHRVLLDHVIETDHYNIDYSRDDEKLTFTENAEVNENITSIGANENYLPSVVPLQTSEIQEHFPSQTTYTHLKFSQDCSDNLVETGAMSRVAHEVKCTESKDREQIPLTFKHQTMLHPIESRVKVDIPQFMEPSIVSEDLYNTELLKNNVHPIGFEKINYGEGQDSDLMDVTHVISFPKETFKEADPMTCEEDVHEEIPNLKGTTPQYHLSLVGHQLPKMDTPDQYDEFIVSSASFQYNQDLDTEKVLPSMVVNFFNENETGTSKVDHELLNDKKESFHHKISDQNDSCKEYKYTSMNRREERYSGLPNNEDMKTKTEEILSKNVNSLSCSYTSEESVSISDQEKDISEHYNEKLERIKDLQKLVETEIEEFDSKRNKRQFRIIENDLETTETHIVSNVKNVLFESHIVLHPHEKEWNNDIQRLSENKEINESINESISNDSLSSSRESIESVICMSSRSLNDIEELSECVQEDISECDSAQETCTESILEATCTLEDNSPMYVKTNIKNLNDTDKEDDSCRENGTDHSQGIKKKEEDQSFDELKSRLRKMPRKSSNVETKIREKELLESLFQNGLNNTEKKKETTEKVSTKEKVSKHSITLATLNENVKKQTYKIRFKVNLSKESSKSSVLHYLLGCFGGEKLLGQQN